MYLHGRILTEDARIVELETNDYLMPVYTLYLEEVLVDTSAYRNKVMATLKANLGNKEYHELAQGIDFQGYLDALAVNCPPAEYKVTKAINKAEFLCGVNAHDPQECWKIIRRYNTLPFGDIEGVLEDEGFPNNAAFDNRCRCGINNYARYHNVVKRSSFDASFTEIIEARVLDPKV
jgi:hypothetical protein